MVTTYTHLKNGKTVYAVTGETDNNKALDAVAIFRKTSKTTTRNTYKVCDGCLCGNKMYVGDIDRKNKKPCKIVYRKNMEL